MAGSYKLHIKLGDAEFSAEGPEASVKEQFESFRTLLSAKSVASPDAPPRKENPPNQSQEATDRLRRVFTASEDETVVSLKILPRGDTGEPDALLLLLYGFRFLGPKVTDVLAGTLMKAAATSGLRLARIDRVISVHGAFVTEGGAKRGKRYGLNNQGVNRAEEIIKQLDV